MKKRRVLLFILRLLLYFSAISFILIHSGITVSFDRIGIIQWFLIIPLFAIFAFILPEKGAKDSALRVIRNRLIAAVLSLITISIWTAGFSLDAMQIIQSAIISFTLTFLLFKHQNRPLFVAFAKITAIEPFFLCFICLRLLALSRSGEDITGQSESLTQFIFVWTAIIFLLHSVLIYFCLYPKSTVKTGKETAIFIFAAASIFILVLFVLPPDYVKNSVIENLITERMPELIRPDSEHGIPTDSGNRREGRRTLPRGEEQQPGLRGIPEHNWQNRTGRGRGDGSTEDNRQYMVKIVASEREPVYMGDSFRSQLDPVKGFLSSPDEPLNRLASQRFFVTWFNNDPEFDIGRRRQEVFSLSTLSHKYLPWRPIIIDPTILNEDSGPLRYIHQVVSNTHFDDPLKLVNRPSRPFEIFEEYSLAVYFELPLEENDFILFSNWLKDAQRKWRDNRELIIGNNEYLKDIYSVRFFGETGDLEPVNEYLEDILAILTAFSAYQYNLSYNDDHSIAEIKDFLLNTANGDCVEFSNSLALIGRIAGIPSRIVTGYLAAESLQTPAHLRGLYSLRNRIPALQKFPFDNLYMVTNLHSHSWTQFYIPDFGWLDFEATMFAIPPEGSGDFNTWDVVIPLMDENRVFSQIMRFPWQAVLRTIIFLVCFAIIFTYVLRYGREIILAISVKRGGREGARALYLLLLARLASDGKPIKPASKTAAEYAELFPSSSNNSKGVGQAFLASLHFRTFASIYSELCWRKFKNDKEKDERFNMLYQEYKNILKTTRRRGAGWFIIRIFSLRGLAYL